MRARGLGLGNFFEREFFNTYFGQRLGACHFGSRGCDYWRLGAWQFGSMRFGQQRFALDTWGVPITWRIFFKHRFWVET